MIGYWENIPQEWLDKTNRHEIIINGHLDSLDFIEQKQYNWSKYFRIFPRPELKVDNNIGSFLVSNLISSSSVEHRLQDWYLTRIIKDIDKLCIELDMTHIIISQSQTNDLYEEALKDCKKSAILNGSIKNVCETISNAKIMIACDTGFRAVAWGYDIPVISLSKQCYSPGQVLPPQLIRWNPFPELCYPLHHNTSDIISLTKRILENKIYQLMPQLTNWQNDLIKRNYTINKEKSILK